MDLLRVKSLCAVLAGATALMASSSWARAQLLSPGPLGAGHADLEGDDKCEQCHSSGKRIDDQRCLGCHKALDARVRAGEGYHGRTVRGQSCSKCHIDHMGRNARLVRWPGGDRSRFHHSETGWPLKGGHAPVACDKCHTKRHSQGTTYLGVSISCQSCHQDPHKGTFKASCESCHSEATWHAVSLGAFDHDETRYRLHGKHKNVKCEGCHGQPPKYRGLEFGECTACHKDPHKGSFGPKCQQCHAESSWRNVSGMRDKHPGVSLGNGHEKVPCQKCHDRGNNRPPRKGKTCVSCHKPVHEAKFGSDCKNCHGSILWLGLPMSVGWDAHKLTAYPLVGKHGDVACAKCHPSRAPPDKRFRQLTFSRCRFCHDDRHQAEFAQRDQGECAQCHSESGFAPTNFDAKQHESTAYPLDGKHLVVPCGLCHTSTRPRLTWKQPKRQCAQCHANPHGDQFVKEMRDRGCAHCHKTGGWADTAIDHSFWPLTGAHKSTSCAACHGAKKAGATDNYRNTPKECDRCHADEHAGQFRLSEPTRTCAFCHGTTTFELKSFRHDHESITGFQLDGKHKPLACKRCHLSEALRSGITTIRYRLGFRACRDCHKDPHTK